MLSKTFRDTCARALVQYVVWIAYPAVVVTKLPAFLQTHDLSWSMVAPLSMPLVQFGFACGIILPLARRGGATALQAGALALTAGLGNTSFIGFPLVRAYFGESGIPFALLTDQGSFLAVAIFGVALASTLSGSRVELSSILYKVVTFPPFLISVASLVLTATGRAPRLDGWFFRALGSTLTPAALTAVALQLKLDQGSLRRNWRWLTMGLSLKLVILPALLAPLYWYWLGGGESARIVIFEATMAPMITAAIVANRYGLDRELSSLMVGIGIPVSLLTTYAWQLLLKAL